MLRTQEKKPQKVKPDRVRSEEGDSSRRRDGGSQAPVKERKKGALRRHPRAVSGILVLAVASAVAGAWMLTRDGDSGGAPLTRVATVSAGTVEQTVSANGTINAADVEELSFPVGGTVTKVKVAVGDEVSKGQTLAKIDDDALERAVDVARANRDGAAAQLEAAEDSGASDLQITSAEAQLATAKDKLAAAKDDLAAATLEAPIAGTVAAVDLAVGDRVAGSGGGGAAAPSGGSAGAAPAGGSTSSASSTGAQIVVVSTKSYVVDAAVSGTDLAKVEKGQQARITPSGAAAPVFGTVSSVGVVASTASGGASTFPVTIDVTGTPEGLHPGGTASVAIVTKQLEGVLTVPTAALRQENGKSVVTKVLGEARRSVEVTVGDVYASGTEVRSGLVEGDQVEIAVRVGGAGGGARPGGGGGAPAGGLPAGFQLPPGFQIPAGGFGGGAGSGGAR